MRLKNQGVFNARGKSVIYRLNYSIHDFSNNLEKHCMRDSWFTWQTNFITRFSGCNSQWL